MQSVKRKGLMFFCFVILSLRERKYSMVSLVCGIQKIKQMNKQNRNRLTETENKMLVARGEEGRRMSERDEGD